MVLSRLVLSLIAVFALISGGVGAGLADKNTISTTIERDEFIHIHAIAVRHAFSVVCLAPILLKYSNIQHSHCDPGWWYTFEEYYEKWVHGILDAVYTCLNSNSNRTFIWAEISFFERWWRDQYPDVQEKMREFISVCITIEYKGKKTDGKMS